MRLQHSVLVTTLLFSIALPCDSQRAPDKTLGLLNGRWWKEATVEVKVGFVVGYSQHWTATPFCENDSVWFKAVPSYGEVVDGINAFYNEPANGSIPIHGAWKIIALKFNGTSGAEIQRETEFARQGSSSH